MIRVILISDTHGQHKNLVLPEADAIIHSGDITSVGRKTEVNGFLDWFSSLQYKRKIFIPGNHDFFFDYDWKPRTDIGKERFAGKYAGIYSKEEVEKMIASFPDVTYLNDSGTEIEGIKVWGSGITPWFHDWGFNRWRGEEIKEHWTKIPDDINMLISHGPPQNILDKTIEGDSTGCADLLDKIVSLKELRLNVFGHIHEARGHYINANGTIFVNASVLNRNYELVNKPFLIEINDKKEFKLISH